MITSFPSIEGYEESQIKELLIYSLESLFLEDMKRILKLKNDNIICEKRNNPYSYH